MARRRILALIAAVATAAATLVVSQPQPVAAQTTGSITIFVDTVPADGTDIGFRSCLGSGCGRFTLDDDNDPTRPDRITGTGLAPATYTITQDPVPGWTLTRLSCSTDTGVTIDPNGRQVTIALAAGQSVACTFKNESPSLTIVQDTDPNGARDFSYTGCLGSGCDTFTLDDDADPARPRTIAASGLAPGTYTVTQDADATWPVSSISCAGGGPNVAADVANRRLTVVLTGPTDHRTCTFKNVTQSITIVEDDLTDSGQDHTFTGCGERGCSTFTLDDDTDPTHARVLDSGPIPTGDYTLTQDPIPGWGLTLLDCEDEANDLLLRQVTVRLQPGERRTCTFTNEPLPEDRPLLEGVSQISAGFFRTCAVAAGQVYCWGAGYPGDGSERPPTPTRVSNPDGTGPLTDVVEVTSGGAFACARLRDGRAVCWGYNQQGQLGNGSTADAALPTFVSNPEGTGPLTGVTEVSAGILRACARLTDGQVRCWGFNEDGRLGNATPGTNATLPIVVLEETGTGPLGGAVDIAVGVNHLCVALESGQARCWGEGSGGQLGQGLAADSPTPVAVTDPSGTSPLTDVVSISAMWDHTCAALGSGEVRCWGLDGGLGAPGAPLRTGVPVVAVDAASGEPLSEVDSVAGGAFASCATASGGAWCWGANGSGELGDGTRIHRRTAKRVLTQTGALVDAASLSAGYSHTCAVLTTGTARCWGQNLNGELGDGTRVSRTLPVSVVAP